MMRRRRRAAASTARHLASHEAEPPCFATRYAAPDALRRAPLRAMPPRRHAAMPSVTPMRRFLAADHYGAVTLSRCRLRAALR